jgi:hypothetical protein
MGVVLPLQTAKAEARIGFVSMGSLQMEKTEKINQLFFPHYFVLKIIQHS